MKYEGRETSIYLNNRRFLCESYNRSMARFKTKREIIAAVDAIAKLMTSWGLASDEWMIGKEMAFFFNGVIKDPRLIARDTTVYVLHKRLPWKCRPDPKGRVVFPPAKSIYNKQYSAMLKIHGMGIDLYPVPNNHLRSRFIMTRKNIQRLNSFSINVETSQKFIYRIEKLTKYFLKQTVNKIREFYFADEKRYLARLRLYVRIERGLKDWKLISKVEQITKDYTILMKRAYPELFVKNQNILTNGDLSGIVAYSVKKVISGKVCVWKEGQKISKKEKSIFVFSHFYPADTKVLPFAKAILVEGGGLLSHAAIVCREARVPCLVGVRGLCQSVKAGQEVVIDFTKGLVSL